MVDLEKTAGFEWDENNIDKNYKKHGITPREAEELFLDEDLLLLEDIEHSKKEERFIAIGKTADNMILFAVFTMRDDKVRIISVRIANEKERRKYAEKI